MKRTLTFLSAILISLACLSQTANNSYSSAPSVTLNSTVSTCTPSPVLNATGSIAVSNLGTATHDGPSSGYCITTLGISCKNVWVKFTIPAGVNGIAVEGTSSGSSPSGTSTASVCLWRYASSTWTCVGAGGGCSNSSIIANYSSGSWNWSRTRRINVTPGQTYYLEIGTYSSTSNFNFNFRIISYGATPSNISCATAINANGTQCNNGSVAPNFGAPLCWLYNENTVYFTLTAPSGNFTIQANSIICDGASSGYLQMAVYSSCPSGCTPSPSPLGCDVGSGGGSPYPAVITISSGVSAGQLLYLIIDGDAGAVCQWTFNIINNTLPVEFRDFNVECSNNQVNCYWNTASEINNHYFTIERSPDGINYITIGYVEGKGTTNSPSAYTFTDRNAPSGIMYYRLKQTDFDGSSVILKQVAINTEKCTGTHLTVDLYPNPFSEQFNINIYSKENTNAEIFLTNPSGRIVKTLFSGYLEEGSNNLKFSAGDVPPGFYYLKVIAGNEVINHKIIKQ